MIWTDWLSELGVLCLAASSLKQIAEEWKTRGLTDTSYPALALLAIGSLALVLHAALIEQSWTAGVPAIPLTLAIGLLYLKVKDFVCTKCRL